MHGALDTIQYLAGPFIRSGGMDRMGRCPARPAWWSKPVFREKGLVIVKVTRSFSDMSR
jgi:hypothetical protein